MVKQPSEMSFEDKKFSMILYGSPGMGKTTLALSAPDPVLIDFDRGISRVKAYHRGTTIVCDTYEEVVDDLSSPEVKSCQTLIVDTGGSFVTYLQDWAMRTNPANRQKSGKISQPGWGAVKSEFSRFTNHIRDVMNKNIIYVFHSNEDKDKDGNPIQRLICEGSARNMVWQPCDFGGFMQMIGDARVVSFTPEQEFFAKGCHGIEGRRAVPVLGPTDKNDFLTRLFTEARTNIMAEAEEFAGLKDQYESLMVQICDIIEGVNNAADADKAVATFSLMEHVLTSRKESSALLRTKVASLGLIWDAKARAHKPATVK